MLNIFATCLLCLAPLQILSNRGLGTGIFFLGCSISLASSHWLIMFHQFWCIVALSSWSHWNSYKTRWCISFWVVQRLESLKSSDLSWNFPVLSAESRKLFATVSCMIYHGYTQLRKAFITLTIHNVPAKSYLGKLHKLLSDLGVLDPCLAFISGPCYPSWNPHGVIVDIEKLDNPILSPSFRPAGWFFNHCLHIPAPTLSICFGMDLSMAARLYVDYLLDCTTHSEYTDTETSKRLHDHLSSTREEIYATLLAFHITVALRKTVPVCRWSMCLVCTSVFLPLWLWYSQQVPSTLSLLERCGATAYFILVPSRVGLPHNKRADRLTEHPHVEYTYNYDELTWIPC